MSRLGEPGLAVKKALWRQNDPEAKGVPPVPPSTREKVLERDGYTCGHCGFRSLKWQEIHHKDDDHANNDLSNLVTLCPWCHGCHHVGFMGASGKATLIWFPEMSQTGLFHLVRVLAVVLTQDRKGESGFREVAHRIYEELGRRRLPLDQAFGEGSHDPVILGNILLSSEEGAVREDRLEGFRILPLLNQWRSQIAYWSASVFGSVPVGTWARLAEKWAIDPDQRTIRTSEGDDSSQSDEEMPESGEEEEGDDDK